MILIQKEDGQVTVRHRDSMTQVRMPIAEVKAYIEKTFTILIKKRG